MWIRQGELYGVGDGSIYAMGTVGGIRTQFHGGGIAAKPKPWGDVDVVKVGSGDRFSVVLLADKSIWATGNRTHGQFPVSSANAKDKRFGSYWAQPGFYRIHSDGVKDFEVGDRHIIVLMEDGRLLSSGDNRLGQCGLGVVDTSTHRDYDGVFDPVLVDGKPVVSGVSYIHANGNSTFFVMNDDLYAVGYNRYGNLGDGSTDNIVKSTKIYPTG